MSEIRLFIACKLPAKFERALTRAQTQLKNAVQKGSFTKPHNLHMTLKFIGEVPPEKAADIALWFAELTPAAPPEGALTAYGSFKTRDGHTVWGGLEVNDELASFAAKINRELAEHFGIKEDRRVFKPHITLARRVRLPESMEELSRNWPRIERAEILPSIVLFQSEFSRQGMIYTPLKTLTF